VALFEDNQTLGSTEIEQLVDQSSDCQLHKKVSCYIPLQKFQPVSAVLLFPKTPNFCKLQLGSKTAYRLNIQRTLN